MKEKAHRMTIPNPPMKAVVPTVEAEFPKLMKVDQVVMTRHLDTQAFQVIQTVLPKDTVTLRAKQLTTPHVPLQRAQLIIIIIEIGNVG